MDTQPPILGTTDRGRRRYQIGGGFDAPPPVENRVFPDGISNHFGETYFRKQEEAIRHEIDDLLVGIHTRVTLDLFPKSPSWRNSGMVDFAKLPDEIRIRGYSDSAVLDGFGCRWGGETPLLEYMDVTRAFLAFHETGHLLGVLNNPNRGSFRFENGKIFNKKADHDPADPDRIGRDEKKEETTADVAAAIYLLNTQPANPRIEEFLSLFALRRDAAGIRLPHHNSAETINALLQDEPLWRHPKGMSISHLDARKAAEAFLDDHPALAGLKVQSVNENAAARHRFCHAEPGRNSMPQPSH